MAQSAASYGAAVLHAFGRSTHWRRASPKALHLPHFPLRLTMKHCTALAPQYEAAPLRSAMKLSRFASKVDVVFAKPSVQRGGATERPRLFIRLQGQVHCPRAVDMTAPRRFWHRGRIRAGAARRAVLLLRSLSG